jgi:3'-phosphoadenosine 5'-phosphosulfate sulfotransferase (PAPS reductase)/FAD synthetase
MINSSSTSSNYNLTHLKVLEAESIHIIREVAAEFERRSSPDGCRSRCCTSIRPGSFVK